MTKTIPRPEDDKDQGKSEYWYRVLKTALDLPGARIDRASFLKTELSKHFPEPVVKRTIETRPAGGGNPKSAIHSIAMANIAWQRGGVSAVSFITGVPGGFWMLGTIPADLTQFFWHVAVILQKLSYLYGFPSLTDKDQELDAQTLSVFTIFIGVMFGVASASRALGVHAEKVAEQVFTRLPREAPTKWGIYVLAKEIAKWIGVKLTKQTFSRLISKSIPFISGFISGGISWIAFSSMSKRLRNHLEGLRLSEPGDGVQIHKPSPK